MTANRLPLAVIAALAFAGAAHPQETDSHVASTGEQGFRRFASLCRDQKAPCDAAFRFGALVGADAAMRCALADDQIACFKTTMNSQEEERKALTAMRTYRSCLDVYGPRPIATGLAKAGPKVTTADVYPAS
jgi:hypothetical protein